jgi:hypothetical protein
MRMIESVSCVKFVERKRKKDHHFIKIYRGHGETCYSKIGMSHGNPQKPKLDKDTNSFLQLPGFIVNMSPPPGVVFEAFSLIRLGAYFSSKNLFREAENRSFSAII